MRRKSMLVGIALTGSLFFASNAQAAILDTTDGTWIGATTSITQNIAGFGSVTISALNLNGNLNADSVGSLVSPPCGFLSCTSDGVGIGDDEISYGTNIQTQEVLRVAFNDGPADISALGFLDLFDPEGIGAETAEWMTDGGTSGSAPSSNAINGWVDVTGLALTGVNYIDFFTDVNPQSDFALAYIEGTTAVPIPAGFALLGSAFGLLGFLGWRRRNS